MILSAVGGAYDSVSNPNPLSQGEAFLTATDADAKVGDGMSVEFVDGTGRTLSVDVSAPAAAAGSDPTQHSNGIQLFVKDVNGGSQYGPWNNISGMASPWATLSMTIGGAGNPFTSTNPPFDPTLVNTVGVKFGMNPAYGSSETYAGEIGVDNVVVTP
jgi:hypothetical protein